MAFGPTENPTLLIGRTYPAIIALQNLSTITAYLRVRPQVVFSGNPNSNSDTPTSPYTGPLAPNAAQEVAVNIRMGGSVPSPANVQGVMGGWIDIASSPTGPVLWSGHFDAVGMSINLVAPTVFGAFAVSARWGDAV